jgi:FkbM family methyltransferase
MVVGMIFYFRVVLPTPQPKHSSGRTRTEQLRTVSPSADKTLDRNSKQFKGEQLKRHKKSLIYLGTAATNTGWKVDTICLKDKSTVVVYGVGAGEDISWDIGLVEKFNANVFIFDPTEKSIKYTSPLIEKYSQTHPNKLSHTPEGMSNKQGTLTFAMPANPDHVSMRTADLATTDMKKTVTVPVNTLRNWMSQHKHTYLDILKIDIEGSEYDVLETLIADDDLPFTQLLVEYHDRFLQDKSRHTKLMSSLKNAGFDELWSGHNGQEVGYIKVADLQYCEDGKSDRHVSGGGRAS